MMNNPDKGRLAYVPFTEQGFRDLQVIAERRLQEIERLQSQIDVFTDNISFLCGADNSRMTLDELEGLVTRTIESLKRKP